MKKLISVVALCVAFCAHGESISGQQSGVATSLRNQIRADHGPWVVRAQKETSIDANDEVFLLGTNCRGENSSEPSLCYGLENDYSVIAQGSGSLIRSLETYMNFNAGHGGSGSRPFFYSFVPATSGDGYINYGYMSAGPNLLQTIGGGGWQVDSGTHGTGVNNEGTLKLGVDIEGVKAYNLQLFNDTYADPITTSNTTNMTVVLPTGRGNEFSAGSLIGFYSKTGAGTPGYNTTPVATAIVTSISTDTLTTSFNNSGTRIVTNAMVARKLSPPAFTSSADCGAFGTTCNGTSQERLKVAGNFTQTGSYYLTDPGATIYGAGTGSVLNFSKLSTARQVINFSSAGAVSPYGIGFPDNYTFGVGTGQTTDSNFNVAHMFLTMRGDDSTGGVLFQNPARSGTNDLYPNHSAIIQIAKGTSGAEASMYMEDMSGAPATPTSGAVLYSRGGMVVGKNSAGTESALIRYLQRAVPTAGGTVTATSRDNVSMLLVPAGTLATLTVNLPATPFDNQIFQLVSTQTITALRLTDGAGVDLAALPALTGGAFGTLNAGNAIRYMWSATDSVWIRLQ